MQSRLMGDDNGARTFVVVLEPGEEALATLGAFVREQQIGGASLTAIGAFSQAVVGWFDFEARDYRRIPVQSQCEVLSLIGDVAQTEGGTPGLHLHAVLGLSDGTTRGGHLLEGRVQPTLEIVLRETPKNLRRRHRPELGIALIDLDQPSSPA